MTQFNSIRLHLIKIKTFMQNEICYNTSVEPIQLVKHCKAVIVFKQKTGLF
jgi:hypothetical protein